MNVCLFVSPLSNYILCAMDRKLDVKSKMSFFPRIIIFFFLFFGGGVRAGSCMDIFKSNNCIWRTGVLSSFIFHSFKAFMYVIWLGKYDSVGGGREKRVCMWLWVGRMVLTRSTVSFHMYIYTHTFTFRVCLKRGRGGKVHKRGVAFSKTVLKH